MIHASILDPYLKRTSCSYTRPLWLRTVADGGATSSEHTLNPQLPRVKREPLLRIREKTVYLEVHPFNYRNAGGFDPSRYTISQ